MGWGRREQKIKSQMEKGEVDNRERDREGGREGRKTQRGSREIAGEGEDGGKYRGRGSGEV